MKYYEELNRAVLRNKNIFTKEKFPFIKDEYWNTFTEQDEEKLSETVNDGRFIIIYDSLLFKIIWDHGDRAVTVYVYSGLTLSNYNVRARDKSICRFLYRISHYTGELRPEDIKSDYNKALELNHEYENNFDMFIKRCIVDDDTKRYTKSSIYPILDVLKDYRIKDPKKIYQWLKESELLNRFNSLIISKLKMEFEPQKITFKDYLGSIGENE